MKRLAAFYTPPGWDTSQSQVNSQHSVRLSPEQFDGSYLYTLGVERGTVRVKCFAEKIPSGPKSDALTTEPPRLPLRSVSAIVIKKELTRPF